MLVDSHCHLTDDQFSPDRSEVLQRASQAGVETVLSIASDAADSRRVVELVDEFSDVGGIPALWGTAGVHPHEAGEAADGDLDVIREILEGHSRVVAVGETGLDFFYDHSPRKRQEELFRAHLDMAESLSLPVVVHCRSADDVMIRVLTEKARRVRGVLHCFTGSRELMEKALEFGWMVSFTGIITFKKYDSQELVRLMPRDRIMVETDAPYLAPVPYRGRRNEPSYVPRVAESLAAIRNEDLEDVMGYTTTNAVRFFGFTS